MKSFTGGVCFAFAASVLGSIGCGATPSDEAVAQATSALTIGSWNDLVNNLGTTGNYTLTTDINASGKTWTPKSFSGTFDGGNHTISGLSISMGGLFSSLDNATVKNLKLTGMTITGSANKATFGGLAATATDSNIQNCAVEVNINMTAAAAGGIVGAMYGGSIYRSYAKGSVVGNMPNAGGLVGYASVGSARLTITESYAQMTVNPDTSNTGSFIRAGGLVGYGYGLDIHDAYVVGDVTGRGAAGGMIGQVDCDEGDVFLLYKTIYRGNVVDKNASNGWAGAIGTYSQCTQRFLQNFYDSQLDPSAGHAASGVTGYSTNQLRSPTSVIGGVFCEPDVIPGRCGDNTWASPPWTAGNNAQHHVLLNMPGPNTQLR